MKKSTQRLVGFGILLVVFSLVYAGLYLSCVSRGTTYEFTKNGKVPIVVGYRLPWDDSVPDLRLWGIPSTLQFERSFAATIFAPANWIDRGILRREFWNRISTLL